MTRGAPIEPEGVLTGIRSSAILFGLVVDILATFALTIVFFIAVPASLITEGGGEAADAAALSLLGVIGLLVIGAFGTAAGGYAAAGRARQLPVAHGFWVGIAGLVVAGLASLWIGSEDGYPVWATALGAFAAVPAGALGGYIWLSRQEARPVHPRSGSGL